MIKLKPSRGNIILKRQSKIKISYLGKQSNRYNVCYYTLCFRSFLSKLAKCCLFCNGSSASRDAFQLFSKLNIVCILSFKLLRNPRNPRENSPCFYRVMETRFFLAFDQSAPVFLKGYFIISLMISSI
jgi:hypothetical protein